MAEAGSFADRVKQQADIVRVIGEYVRLKKSGQNFTGLCPVPPGKVAIVRVHPVKQIYHCFGCGVGGDVFKFVMEMDKCHFRRRCARSRKNAASRFRSRASARPKSAAKSSSARRWWRCIAKLRHFLRRQFEGTPEGKAARAYLADRGLDGEAIARFGLGFAPSGGDALLRHLKAKYSRKKLLEVSGLVGRDPSGRFYDRFRRRIMFPISNEAGKVIAFGGRAMGDDLPKYLNSPETPIYTKSTVLYHLDRAKEAIRQSDFAILVEGYMDAIAVARAGIGKCGGQLRHQPDGDAGEAAESFHATRGRELRSGHRRPGRHRAFARAAARKRIATCACWRCPGGRIPTDSSRQRARRLIGKLLRAAPPYLDYLIGRARQMDLTTAQGKVARGEFPDALRAANSESAAALRVGLAHFAPNCAWTSRCSREALAPRCRRAPQRSESPSRQLRACPRSSRAERRLVQMLIEADDISRTAGGRDSRGRVCTAAWRPRKFSRR